MATDTQREKPRLILRAAITVFARSGYHTSRVSDVAKEAGVAYGLVYHYFGSKEDLLETIFRRTWSRMLEAVEELERAEARLGLRRRLGLAGVEPKLEERAQFFARRQHVLVPRPTGRQLHDPDVVVAATVAALVRRRFVERRQRSTTAEKAHAHGISRLRPER